MIAEAILKASTEFDAFGYGLAFFFTIFIFYLIIQILYFGYKTMKSE
jgi:hypothetical protein